MVPQAFGFKFLSRQIHDRRSVAAQKGGMLGAPLLECMDVVRSYKVISGSAFARLIQKSSFQLGQVLQGLLEGPASVRVPAKHPTGVPVDW